MIKMQYTERNGVILSMLSWRLWQTIAEPSIRNPIFSFVRDKKEPIKKSQSPRLKLIRYGLIFVITLLMLIAFIRVPEFLILLFQIPLMMIVLIIISPLFLPLAFVMIGGYLVNKISQGIHREKYQYTYELLCASPDGSLYANWSFAKGILHRYGWFPWLKSATHIFYRLGQFITASIFLIVTIGLLTGSENMGVEQIQLVASLVLLLGLFYTTMQQSLALSFIIGLYTGSMDISRHDASLIAVLSYTLLQILPFVIAFGLYLVPTTLMTTPNLIVEVGINIIALLSIYLLRELALVALWFRLKYHLNATSDTTQTITRELRRPSVFNAT